MGRGAPDEAYERHASVRGLYEHDGAAGGACEAPPDAGEGVQRECDVCAEWDGCAELCAEGVQL